jgi:hypothetical protein
LGDRVGGGRGEGKGEGEGGRGRGEEVTGALEWDLNREDLRKEGERGGGEEE